MDEVINMFPRSFFIRVPLPYHLEEIFPILLHSVIQNRLYFPLIGQCLRIEHCPLMEVEGDSLPTEDIRLMEFEEGGMRSDDVVRRDPHLIAVLAHLRCYFTRSNPTSIQLGSTPFRS